MPNFKITSAVGYQLAEPEAIATQTTKTFQDSVKLQHDGNSFSGIHAMQLIWSRMTPSEQGDFEQALYTMSFDKAFLLGLGPLMIVLNPEQALERAIDAGFPLWNNKNDTSFVTLVAPAQHLACLVQPAAIKGICGLFQHQQIAGQISLDCSLEDDRPQVMARFVEEAKKPVALHRMHLQSPEEIFELNESGPCQGFLRNLHAFCFANVEKAKALGAHFAPLLGGSAYGAVACAEAESITAGYDWRTKGVLPLLPKAEQAGFFIRLVTSHLGVARGKKGLAAAIAADPQSFRAALMRLSSEEAEALVGAGVLSAAHLDNLNDAGRNAILERDLGL